MRHVASGETQRQCSTKESAHTAPAKHQAYELPMNSKLVARKGGIGAYCSRCCDASRVDRDDAHAFTNYASPSPAEIGALGDEGRIRRCTGPGSYPKRSEKIVSRDSDHKIRERKK